MIQLVSQFDPENCAACVLASVVCEDENCHALREWLISEVN